MLDRSPPGHFGITRRRSRRGRAGLAATLLAVPVLAACGSEDADNVVRFFTFNEASFVTAAQSCTDQSDGAYQIVVETLPNQADQQREQLVRRLAAEDSTVDIMAMDVIWTAEFFEAGWILPWEGAAADAASEGVLEGPLASATYDDQLAAAPFTSNTQLLWYRTDRVSEDELPETWEDLIALAESLPEGERTIQVQGSRYEGYTVWFNSLVAGAGGEIITGSDERPESALGGEPTVAALEVMQALATSTAADQSLTTSNEGTNLLSFQTGASTFMVNYPFVYPGTYGTPEVFDNLGWARFPATVAGEPSAPPLGGINLGIGAYSDDSDLAFEAATCLISDENQLESARAGGLPPTREALYDELEEAVNDTDVDGDGEVDEYPLYPFAQLLRDSINDATPRPVTPRYNDVSLAIQRSLHPPEDIEPEQTAQEVTDLVQAALEGRALL